MESSLMRHFHTFDLLKSDYLVKVFMRTFAVLLTKTFLFSCLIILAGFARISAQAYFDYDSKADLGVFRASEGNWYSFSSEAQTSGTARWGLETDRLVPADYDGDGLTDFAVWRPENGTWYVLRSRDGKFQIIHWGT